MRRLATLLSLITLLALYFLAPTGSSAQSPVLAPAGTPQPPSSEVELPNHVLGVLPQATQLAADARSGGTAAEPLTLTIVLNYRDRAGLEGFLQSQQGQPPVSRHSLTPSELANTYGPSQATYNAVLSYLTASGFTLLEGSDNRLTLTVQGTRAQAERAFNVAIGDYQLGGRTFHANDRNPRVPAAIGGGIQAVMGLANLAVPVPQLASAPLESVTPGSSSSCSSNPNNSPMALAKAYDFGGVLAGASPATGAGENIGLLEYDSYTQSDVSLWLSCWSGLGFNLPSTSQLTNEHVGGGFGSPSGGAGTTEVLLDVDTVMGMAPGASYYVFDAPFNVSFATLIQDMSGSNGFPAMDAISISWDSCEADMPRSEADGIDTVIAAAAAANIGVFTASGDTQGFCIGGNNGATGESGTIAVPADSPHGTAVGGTTLHLSALGTYASESWWGSASSGCTKAGEPCGGGFGVSGEFSSGAGYATPSYQASLPIPPSSRSVPDVSADADPNTGILICMSGSCGGFLEGGTSMATPEWAAGMALIDQSLGHRVGSPNQALYSASQPTSYHHPSGMTGTGNDFAHLGLGSFDLGLLKIALSGVTLPTATPVPPTPTPNLSDSAQATTPTSISVSGTSGGTVTANVGFKNNGTTTWTTAAGYGLETTDGLNNFGLLCS